MTARWLWMVCTVCLWIGTAHGAEVDPFETAWEQAVEDSKPVEPPDLFTKLDGQFGKWVVGPLAKVMFFDVVMWDNQRKLGDGVGLFAPIGAPVEGAPAVEKITTYVDQKGYGRQTMWKVEDVIPVAATPISLNIGGLKINLQSEQKDGNPVTMARIPVQRVNARALKIPVWDPEGPEQPVISVSIPQVGFPIKVDRRTMMTEPSEGLAPPGVVPLEPGSRVWVPSQRAERTFVGGKLGAYVVMDPEVRWSLTPLPNPENVKLPIVVLWLVFGAVFFTFRMMFINLRGVKHAILVTLGHYDDPDDPGEISHFQALSSALSATVGLGNIAGVAIAIGLGGPGAVFWLWVAGFVGMSSKFTECTLGQMYRVTDANGVVSGGPMHYLDKGLAELGLGPIGKGLAIVFALMCVGGSLGGGNMFQANQSLEAVAEVVPIFADYPWVYGILLMISVGMVVMGGIKRIGAAASLVVPVMCGVYVLAGAYVLVIHAADVPGAFASIITQAFNPEAGMGGLIGVLAVGFQRASFSNEAGVGSASIAHSAASTSEPIREGIVALLEPFIDTIVVCTVTALVVVVTGVTVAPGSGIKATMDAFATLLPWFPAVLAFAAMLFAFSTMVSWSYYGERAAVWLVGDIAVIPYRIVFLICVFVGSVMKLGNVLDFSDLMILGMAFPNILGALLLSGKVRRALDTYWSDLAAGKFERSH